MNALVCQFAPNRASRAEPPHASRHTARAKLDDLASTRPSSSSSTSRADVFEHTLVRHKGATHARNRRPSTRVLAEHANGASTSATSHATLKIVSSHDASTPKLAPRARSVASTHRSIPSATARARNVSTSPRVFGSTHVAASPPRPKITALATTTSARVKPRITHARTRSTLALARSRASRSSARPERASRPSRTRNETLANAKRAFQSSITHHRVESNQRTHQFIHSFIHSLHTRTHTLTHAHTHTKSRIRPRVYSYTSASPKTEIINLI